MSVKAQGVNLMVDWALLPAGRKRLDVSEGLGAIRR